MLFWWTVFGMPLAASTVEWVILGSHRRDQLRHLNVTLAMIFSTTSTLLGLWALPQFQRAIIVPAGTTYRIECTGWLLATISSLAAFTWIVVERNWFSWMAFAISGWMFLIWMLMLVSA